MREVASAPRWASLEGAVAGAIRSLLQAARPAAGARWETELRLAPFVGARSGKRVALPLAHPTVLQDVAQVRRGALDEMTWRDLIRLSGALVRAPVRTVNMGLSGTSARNEFHISTDDSMVYHRSVVKRKLAGASILCPLHRVDARIVRNEERDVDRIALEGKSVVVRNIERWSVRVGHGVRLDASRVRQASQVLLHEPLRLHDLRIGPSVPWEYHVELELERCDDDATHLLTAADRLLPSVRLASWSFVFVPSRAGAHGSSVLCVMCAYVACGYSAAWRGLGAVAPWVPSQVGGTVWQPPMLRQSRQAPRSIR